MVFLFVYEGLIIDSYQRQGNVVFACLCVRSVVCSDAKIFHEQTNLF